MVFFIPAFARLLPVLLIALSTAAYALAQEELPFDEERPAVGYWTGQIHPAGRDPSFAVFEINAEEDGTWSAKATAMMAFAVETPCKDVQIDGRSVSFTLETMSLKAQLTGEVSEDGQHLAGTLTHDDGEGDGTFELSRQVAADALPGARELRGGVQAPGGGRLDMSMIVGQTAGGEWVAQIAIPDQGLRRFPLVDVTVVDGNFSASIPGMIPAHIRGDFDFHARTLSGAISQGGMSLPIELSPDGAVGFAEPNRPQDPEPPFPYETRDIVVEHPDGHRLAGNLTVPDREQFGEGPFPTVILISGSGQQDRDAGIFGHRPFLVMADYLTRRGIAVMRYDDRGVGESTGVETLGVATSEDFAADALAVLEHLRSLDVVDDKWIGTIGHSEGALIAALMGRKTQDLAFVVLLAGPGVPGRDLLPMQLAKAVTAQGASAEQATALRGAIIAAIELMEAEAPEEQVQEVLREAATITAEVSAGGDEVQAQVIAMQYEMLLTNPWMRFFSSYDPRPDYAALECPILACNGTLDLQVWHEQNLDAIAEAVRAADGDITIKRYEGLNHLFQPATTGSCFEYSQIEVTFDETVLADLAAWIDGVTGRQTTPERAEEDSP